jgi:RHH-type transcriptional regulator, proline utilization regulon repressor / proline dehydrogenase / delta 1-pyrroline-5-carboxylate dehydrogenase
MALAQRAARLGIQLTIDAEEADRLDLSLDVIEALALDPATRAWPGWVWRCRRTASGRWTSSTGWRRSRGARAGA